MIDQIKTPKNFNPARQIKGVRQLAKFIEHVVFPMQRFPHQTVGRWIKAGLLPAPVESGAGANPSIWLEGAVIEGLKSAQRAAEILLDHQAAKRGVGRPSLAEVRLVQIAIEQAAANDAVFAANDARFNATKTNF